MVYYLARSCLREGNSVLLETSGRSIGLATSRPIQEARELGYLHTNSCQQLVMGSGEALKSQHFWFAAKEARRAPVARERSQAKPCRCLQSPPHPWPALKKGRDMGRAPGGPSAVLCIQDPLTKGQTRHRTPNKIKKQNPSYMGMIMPIVKGWN